MHTGNMDQKHKPKYFLIMCCSDQLQYNCTEKIEMTVANTAGKKLLAKRESQLYTIHWPFNWHLQENPVHFLVIPSQLLS